MKITIVEFEEIVFTAQYLYENNAKHNGLRENDIKYFGLHNNLFYQCIDDDDSPSKALKEVTRMIKNDLLSRDTFLQIVSREVNFDKYTKLENEWHKKVIEEYIYVLSLIDNPKQVSILEPITKSGHQAFEIIKTTIYAVLKKYESYPDKEKYILYLKDVLGLWERNFYKGHPSILYKAFKYLVEIDKTTSIEGNLLLIDNLYYALLKMPLYKELKLRDAFICSIVEALDCNIEHARAICTIPTLMTKRTFEASMRKLPLKSLIEDINSNISLPIPLS